MPFSVKNIPDLSGKTFLVTGASSGIGINTALELARKNGHVILATRSKEKTMPVIERIKKETGNDKLEFMELDLSSLKSVDNFANEYISKNLPLHCLINNAGTMGNDYGMSQDGIEIQFATNHIGHFHLTNRLLPILEKSAPSRIVVLASEAHRLTYSEGIRFDKINDKQGFGRWSAYGQSKLANILFARELTRRLEGKNIIVNSVHPGAVATDLGRNLRTSLGFLGDILMPISRLFLLSPENGALTSLYVATSPEIEEKNYQGEYFVPIAKLSKTTELAQSKELAQKLWEFSEKLVNEKLEGISKPSEEQKQTPSSELKEN